MKILVIDNDAKRINIFKSLESSGHLVQVLETWPDFDKDLNRSVCQILVLGPDPIAGPALHTFSEWRNSLDQDSAPLVVGLGPRLVGAEGIDHFLPLPDHSGDAEQLSKLPGVPPEAPVVDYDAAMKVVDGDEDLFRDIGGILIDDGPRRIQSLTQNMESRDWPALREGAHLMKGSALNLAAEPLRTASQNLEQAGIEGHPTLIPFWFDQVMYEYRRLETYLQNFPGEAEESP